MAFEMKDLDKEDMWALILGAAALATGGGDSALTYEEFNELVDPVLEQGFKPRLIDPKEIKDNDWIFMNVECGGDIEREYQERYMIEYFPPGAWYKQLDLIYPLNSWSKKENVIATERHLKKLEELIGGKPVAYLPFEIGPLDIYQLVDAAKRSVPLVDADCAGYRAVPELSLTGLNIIDAPITPYTIGTPWGDIIVGVQVLSHQRFEDICRAIANISGGECAPAIALKGEIVKKGTAHNTISFAIEVGKAIIKARESGDDPVEAIIRVTKGYKIFEGKIAGFTTEGKGAFTWGNIWIEGSGDFEGKTLRIWYKNENQISWIDERPYITCPDPFTVIEKESGLGLSNFRPEWWVPGKEVAVIGMKAWDLWRTEKGLRIYNPKRFGFDIEYVPIEERLSKI